jgi:alkylhydroperoxidase family enzyme
VHHHGAGLRAILAKDGVAPEDREAVIGELQTSPLAAPHLSAAEQVLLAYAEVLTLTPQAVAQPDIDALRGAGYDDRAIHDACAIIGYFAFVNRIADGLGVELETNADAEAKGLESKP